MSTHLSDADLALAAELELAAAELSALEDKCDRALLARSFDLAAALARIVVTKAPERTRAWHLLAAASAELGAADVAVAALAEVVAREPKNLGAWVDLAEARLMQLDYAGAAAALTTVLDADPEAKTPHGVRAQILVVETLTKNG